MTRIMARNSRGSAAFQKVREIARVDPDSTSDVQSAKLAPLDESAKLPLGELKAPGDLLDGEESIRFEAAHRSFPSRRFDVIKVPSSPVAFATCSDAA